MAFGEVMMPMTEHSAEILAGSWPASTVMSWSGYAMAYTQAANTLFKELDVQMDIKQILAPMEGAFIDAARGLAAGRETTLQNRIEAYRHISKKAHWAANELQSTKQDLVEIVNQAEENIQTSRDNAEKAKAVAQQSAPLIAPAAIAAIEAQLQSSIAAIVATAKADAQARDAAAAGTVTALSTDISQWAAPFANHLFPASSGMPGMPGGGLPAAPPSVPAPQDTTGVQPAEYTSMADNYQTPAAEDAQQNTDGQNDENRTIQQTAFKQPDKIEPHETSKPSTPSTPSTPSSPSSPSSAGSSPASVLGKMMQPASSSSSSPASSSSSAASSPSSATQSSQLANANGANAANGTGATNAANAAAGRAPGMASLGSGLAESSARMASGAVNTATNAVSAATNVGTNVAHNVAQAAAQAPAAGPAATTSPASVGGAPTAASPPMGMMPPSAATAGGVGPVSPVTGGPPAAGAPTPTSPAAAAAPLGSAVPPAAGSAGASLAPVAVQGPSIRGIGADGANGDVIFDQAMDAGRDVITALVAQTLGSGYIEIHYATSLIWERGGTISAWIATSEGASYIPLGVRIPQDVRLSVIDPIVGHQLSSASAEAGGADPLEIIVRQAEAREQAAPGSRVLAIASTLPMARVIDWAGVVGARPVSVNPREVQPSSGIPGGSMAHRCAVAMPWEWGVVNTFSEQDRLKVAARHSQMAANVTQLSGRATDRVIDLFEQRKPIEDALWADVAKQRFMALIEYQTAMKNAGQGGAESPARLLATARAAEVVMCLRNFDSVDGCADLLYASRLAGAPLHPAAASGVA